MKNQSVIHFLSATHFLHSTDNCSVGQINIPCKPGSLPFQNRIKLKTEKVRSKQMENNPSKFNIIFKNRSLDY